MSGRVAIIGSGVSGLVCGWLLHRHGWEVTVLEADNRIGGHAHTHDIRIGNDNHAVDIGFIVFNHATYPLFTRLLTELGVETQPTTMSFSVRADVEDLEYAGSPDPRTLFAQKRNLLRPRFWGMLRDLRRFYAEAPALLQTDDARSVGQWLRDGGYGDWFRDYHLRPMAAAVWSAPLVDVDAMPMRFLVRFFHNHGFLQFRKRPQWYTITGGSRTYVKALIAEWHDRIRTGCPVRSVCREVDGVRIHHAGGELFVDQVVVACHADQALRLLTDASVSERDILGAMPYHEKQATLHRDASVLPRRRRAWAAWNQHAFGVHSEPRVTYCMNLLQHLPGSDPILVSLDADDRIDPERVEARMRYAHPMFTEAGVRAQQRYHEIAGRERRTHFAGAYWFNGFHEDGVRSAVRVCEDLGAAWP